MDVAAALLLDQGYRLVLSGICRAFELGFDRGTGDGMTFFVAQSEHQRTGVRFQPAGPA